MAVTNFTETQAAFGLFGYFDLVTDSTKRFWQGTSAVWTGYITGTAATLACGAGGSNPYFVSIDDGAPTAPTLASGVIQLFTGLSDTAHKVVIICDPGYTPTFNWTLRTGTFLSVTGAAPAIGKGSDLGDFIYVQKTSTNNLNAYSYSAIFSAPVTPNEQIPDPGITNYASGGSLVVRAKCSDLWVYTGDTECYYGIDGADFAPVVTLNAAQIGWKKIATGLDNTAYHDYYIVTNCDTANISPLGVMVGGSGSAFATPSPSVRAVIAQIGDSITFGTGSSTAAVALYKLANYLGMVGITLGKPGQTTSGLTTDISSLMAPINNPVDILVVAIGKNDGTSITFKTDYAALIAAILALGSPPKLVICLGITPLQAGEQTKNDWIAQVVNETNNRNVVYIDSGAFLPISTVDSIHPTAVGTIEQYIRYRTAFVPYALPYITYSTTAPFTKGVVGSTLTFTAASNTTITGWQWQSAPILSLYSNTPGTWADISGATSASYTTPTLSSSDNGKFYRVKATSALGVSFSKPLRTFITGLGVSGKALFGEQSGFNAWAIKAHSKLGGAANALFRKRQIPGQLNTDGATIWSNWLFASSPQTVLPSSVGSYTITGIAAGLIKNSAVATAAGSYALTGIAALLKHNYSTPLAVGSYVLSGVAARLLHASNFPSAVGVYSLTGQVALLKYARISPAAQGAYVLTGIAANLGRASTIGVSVGTYALSGQAALLKYARISPEAVGNYALTGIAAGLKYARVTQFAVGAYSLIGKAANLVRTLRLIASAGAYSYSGIAALLKINHVNVTANGAYVLAGQAVGLFEAHRLLAAVGAYNLTGQNAGLYDARRLGAVKGAYSLTGLDAGLSRLSAGGFPTIPYALTGIDARLLKASKATAAPGAYVLTGIAAVLSRVSAGTFLTGSYVLTGKANRLLYSHVELTNVGSYAVTGISANLLRSDVAKIGQGVYSLTGNAIALSKLRAIVIASGAYSLVGKNAGLYHVSKLVGLTGSYSLIGLAVSLNKIETFIRSLDRTYFVPDENRVYSVPDEDRLFNVNDENRMHVVADENRRNEIN